MHDWLSHYWYETVYCTCAVGMTVGFSLRIEGSRHVPRTGPVLVIANHQSFLDPALVGLAAGRHLQFLARKTLFRIPAFAALIRSLNAVPVDQEGLGIEGLRTVMRQLELGKAVLVFPEGERTPDGALHPLQPGIHLLLKRTPAPIVPMGLAGAFAAWPRWRPLPVPAPLFLPAGAGTLAVSVGRPIDPGPLMKQPRAQVLEQLLAALQGQAARAHQIRRKDAPVSRSRQDK